MNREREIFLDALDRPAGLERDAFLDAACERDERLRKAVDSLLASHREDDFLVRPAMQSLGSSSSSPPSRMPGPLMALFEKPGDRIGRYKLLEIIGEGGGGTVFMAEQEVPVRRKVALKVVKPGMDTKSVIARFETERQALAMMDHPNIAKVLDAGTTVTGRPFFVMELVRGIRITDYCDENRLTTSERLRLFIQVCQAIQHAHQKGVIHRDVKPSNLLVTLHDGVAVPKVIDFGIAKAIDQRLGDRTFFTEFRAFLGTPAYMSPEQAEMSGLDIDTRADIYSLGVVLYEMLTGRTPFDPKELAASGLDEMRRTIREREPLRPSTRLRSLSDADRTATARRQGSEPARLAGTLDGDLDWIVLKALEKDRTRRYETANGLAMDVRRYLDDEPVLARPPSRIYRFRKLVHRNRAAFAAMGAVGVALLGGLAVATWQYLEKSGALEQVSEAEAHQRRLGDRARRAQEAEKQLRVEAEAQERIARHKAYAADINLSQHALAANNLGRARELLSRHRPDAGRPDLRHWEWAYLWQNCGSDALFTLCRNTNSVTRLDASHDGRWVVVETSDALTVWDVRTRRIHAKLADKAPRANAAFSPSAPLLAYSEARPDPGGNASHRIRLWDAAERRFLATLPLGSSCRALEFSRDGLLLMTVTGDGEVETWNVQQAVRLGRIALPVSPRPAPPFGTSVCISPDLRFLALAVDGLNLRICDARTGEVRWTSRAADELLVTMAFSPDGLVLATGSGFVESTVRLWNVADGSELARLEGHRTWVSSLEFWPDGQTLASASADQTIRLWDVSDVLRTTRPSTPSARRRIPGTETTTPRPHAALQGHELEVWSLALLSDGTTLVSGSKDGSVLVWDTTRRPRDRSRVTLPAPARAWRFSPDSRSIVTIDSQGRASRWRGDDFQEAVPLAELGSSTLPVLLSQDARFAVVSTPSGHVRIRDLVDHAAYPDWKPDGPEPAIPVAMNSDAGRLHTRHPGDGTLREWEIKTGKQTRVWSIPEGPRSWTHFAIAPDSDQWIHVAPDGAGWLGSNAGEPSISFGLGLGQVSQLALSPQGDSFAVASGLGQGVVWGLRPLAKRATVAGFLQGVHGVAYSPDGRRLAFGSDGREAIKLWDVEASQELITLPGEGSGFRTVQFSPDGLNLGASNSKGILHVWRAGYDPFDAPAVPGDP